MDRNFLLGRVGLTLRYVPQKSRVEKERRKPLFPTYLSLSPLWKKRIRKRERERDIAFLCAFSLFPPLLPSFLSLTVREWSRGTKGRERQVPTHLFYSWSRSWFRSSQPATNTIFISCFSTPPSSSSRPSSNEELHFHHLFQVRSITVS